jgi:choline dehydrogenase-like flavoprotein
VGEGLVMIIDGRRVTDGAVVETDVCVIGSGPAGMTLAGELAHQTDRQVVVIESGSVTQNEDAQDLAVGAVVGQPYFPLHETRVRRVGGSSWSWGGVLCKLDAIDFDRRQWVEHSGWPIRYEDVSRHYPAALAALGVTASPDVSAAPSAVPGSDVEPGEVYFTHPKRFGADCTSTFRGSDRLHIYTDSSVVSLEPGSDGARIDRAEVASLTGTRWKVSAQVFVVAGGGIENARLLMLTNRKHGADIGDRGGQLGRFFMEHPRLTDQLWVDGDTHALDHMITGAAGTLRFGRLRLTPEAQEHEQLLNYLANVSYGYAGQDGPSWNSVRRLAIAVRRPWRESPFFQDAGGGPMGVHWADVGVAVSHPIESTKAVIGAGLKPRRLRRFVAISSSMEQAPDPANRVTLTDGRLDALGLPRTTLHWTVGEAERRTYERGLELVLAHLHRALGDAAQTRLERGRWNQDILGTWHHIGTTRMSADPNRGVVDTDLRVHGVDNLYAAGSSVFPTGGAAAPTLTIVALSLRLAEHLRRAPIQAELRSG